MEVAGLGYNFNSINSFVLPLYGELTLGMAFAQRLSRMMVKVVGPVTVSA